MTDNERGGNRRALLASVVCILVFACGRPTPAPRSVWLFDEVPNTSRSYTERELPELVTEGFIGAHVFLSGEGRFGLLPPPPSRLSFLVDLPPRPRLRFAIGSTPLTVGGALRNTEFRVRIVSGGESEVVFFETLRSRQARRWHDREVELEPWSGSRVEVVLETRVLTDSGEDADGVALWGNPVVEHRDETEPRPSLVLISIDCLRADHVGAYGYSRPTTPHLDSFAENAVVFDSAIASAPWTIPSHTTMLTGLPPSLHGVAEYQNAYWGGTAKLLSPVVPVLPEILSEAGYQTHAVVTGAPLTSDYGFQRGFTTFQELPPQASGAVDAALRVLSRAPERDQFLFLHLVDPHTPYQPEVEFKEYSETFIERFGPRPEDISDLIEMVGEYRPPESDADIAGVVQLYDATIAYTDHHLGRLFEELDALGILDRAIIVVTADHGEGFFEHAMWQHSTTLYQDLLHVPLIVRWPDAVHARVSAPAALVDIVPTLLEGAGLSVPPSEGEDLRLLMSRGARFDVTGTVAEVNLASPEGTRSLISFRDGDVKYIATLDGAFDEIQGNEIILEELYDLARDPMESVNLAEAEADTIREMRRRLRDYLERGRRLRELWGQGDALDVDEETLRELRALGYVR